MVPINYLAVVVAAVVMFIIGFLSHGPVTGKLWMKLANVQPTGNEKFADMYGQMAWNLLANLVAAYALAVVYALASSSPFFGAGVATGVECAVLVSIGFIATTSSAGVIWMKQSKQLWLFECASTLVSFIAMGIVIASM